MKKITFTDAAPATLPEGNVKAGETMNLPDMRAVELINLGWAKPDGWKIGDTFTPTPMYASSQEKPAKATPKADATTK